MKISGSGKPGPKNKPLATRKLEGNRSRRAIPEEPKLTAGSTSEPPDWMPAAGQALWREKIPLLRKELKLSAHDEPMAIGMCMAWAFAMQAAHRMRREGLTKKEGDGQTKKHPVAQIWRDNIMLFHQFAAKFGMSPSDRARLFTDLLTNDTKAAEDSVLDGEYMPEPTVSVQ